MKNEAKKTIPFISFEIVVNESTPKHIENVRNNAGATKKFPFSFYEKNKMALDDFDNIKEWVLPKQKSVKHNNIVINLDDNSVHYSSDTESIKNEDLKTAISLLRNLLVNDNAKMQEITNKIAYFKGEIESMNTLNENEVFKGKFTAQIEALKVQVKELENEKDAYMKELEC